MEAHNGRRERMRERIEKEGLESLPEHELLEFLLYYSIPRRDVNVLSHELCGRYGSVRNLLAQNAEELRQKAGLGEHSIEWLKLLETLVTQIETDSAKGAVSLCDEAHVLQYAAEHPEKTGSVVQLCLDLEERLCYRSVIREAGRPDVQTALRNALRDALQLKASHSCLLIYRSEGLPTAEDRSFAGDYCFMMDATGCEVKTILVYGPQHHEFMN